MLQRKVICMSYSSKHLIFFSFLVCSHCIRKHFTYNTCCPACNTKTAETQLRKNAIIDEIITVFIRMKENIDEVVNSSAQTTITKKSDMTNEVSKKSKQTDQSPLKENSEEGSGSKMENVNSQSFATRTPLKNLSTQQQNTKTAPLFSAFSPRKNETTNTSTVNKHSFNRNDEAIKSGTQSQSSKVQCPVCSVEISAVMVNSHLDRCLNNKPKPPNKR